MLERIGRLIGRKPEAPVVPPIQAGQVALPIEQELPTPTKAPSIEAVQPRQKESAEIPHDYFVVIADDRDEHRYATHDAAEAALSASRPEASVSVRVAAGVNDLFSLALSGNRKQQANVVLLDDDYGNEFDRWNPLATQLQKVVEEAEFDLSPIIEGTRFRHNLNAPDSLNLSLLLRAAGYDGKIFVVSSGSPNTDVVKMRTDRVRKDLPTLREGLPIDGFSIKRPYPDRNYISYATSVDSDGDWNYEKVEGGNLEDTMKILLNT